MQYKLITYAGGITNSGGRGAEIHYFDSIYDLDDHIEAVTRDMSEEDREIFLSNIDLVEYDI